MVHLGATDTTVAEGPTQAICDLFSSRYVAWVENGRGNLDVDHVLRAAQVSAADGRQAIVFKQGGVRLEARRAADRRGVALLLYVPSDAVLEGANFVGSRLRDLGLQAP
jgi:hypothetical protein